MENSFLAVERPGLFRSSAWLRAWSKAWLDHPAVGRYEPMPVEGYALSEEQLLAGVFTTSEKLLSFFSVQNAYPFGTSCKSVPSIRSEYFQFPVGPPRLCDDYLKSALKIKWDRFIFADVLVGSADHKSLLAAARLQKLSAIKGDVENTYGVNLQGKSFLDYIGALGKNTRLKIFNSRKKLQQFGVIRVENIWPDRARFFTLLNMFHSQRWGKACYRDRNEILVNTLLDNLAGIGGRADFSVMTLNDVPVSVSFDIFLDGRVYNLQSGYVEHFAKGIALGTLHLGYQIEAAFGNKEAVYYDFMAGRGKNSNYKKQLANAHAEFATITLVRGGWLSLAYRIKARAKRIFNSLADLGVLSSAAFYG